LARFLSLSLSPFLVTQSKPDLFQSFVPFCYFHRAFSPSPSLALFLIHSKINSIDSRQLFFTFNSTFPFKPESRPKTSRTWHLYDLGRSSRFEPEPVIRFFARLFNSLQLSQITSSVRPPLSSP
jgi:hypothetical protein